MLNKGIVRVSFSECNLILPSEIELVYATDKGWHILALKSLAQRLDKGRLAGALNAVEADDKGVVGRLFAVEFELRENEGEANLSFVVDEVGSHDLIKIRISYCAYTGHGSENDSTVWVLVAQP
jgi:hypothetical protein